MNLARAFLEPVEVSVATAFEGFHVGSSYYKFLGREGLDCHCQRNVRFPTPVMDRACVQVYPVVLQNRVCYYRRLFSTMVCLSTSVNIRSGVYLAKFTSRSDEAINRRYRYIHIEVESRWLSEIF